jgi:membrane-bound lytic murein transglycosylase D
MIWRRLLSFIPLLVALHFSAAAADTPIVPKHPTLPEAFDDEADFTLPDPDLWQRIRMGFALEPLDSPLVAEHEAWYSGRPDYIKRFVDRGSRYLHYIVEQVEKRGMPMEIALLPVVESAFNPHAYSRSRASGLWQFIPSTGKNYGLSQDWWKDNRRDIVAATDAALNYLQRLHDMFGSWELALAAYNCGEGCVGRAIAANQRKGLPGNYQSLKLPPETTNYVPKLFAVKNIVLSPATYGIDLETIPDSAYFTTVPAPERIDVTLAARLAGMSVEDFTALNPSHNKPVAIARTGTFVLPLDKAETFRANLLTYDKPLVTWTTYQAKKGESVDAIAKRHGIAGASLRQLNNLQVNKKGRLTASQPVLVPGGKGTSAVVASAAAASPPAPAHVPKAAAQVARTHTVKSGDTLYGIALKYEAELDDLMSLNRLSPRSVIQPGLKLRLP